MLSCDTIIFVKQNRYTISYYFECISDVFPMYFIFLNYTGHFPRQKIDSAKKDKCR